MATKDNSKDYRVTVKQFADILESIVKIYNALAQLNAAMGKAPKGSYLSYPDPREPGRFLPFTQKHLRSANAKFSKTLKELKNYLKVSRRKPRKQSVPESFSGTYTPVFAADALIKFFNMSPEKFGSIRPAQSAKERLMDYLPCLKSGYFLKNSATMLFFIYAHENKLQDETNGSLAKSDNVLNHVFGGQIPSAFYRYIGPDGKKVKITMKDAIEKGLITKPLNTFDVIKAVDPKFDPNRFNTYFFQNMAGNNIYSGDFLNKPELADIATALNKEEIRNAMLQEHNYIKQASLDWATLTEPARKAKNEAKKKSKKLTAGPGPVPVSVQ